MWFKNLQLFRFTSPFSVDAEELHNRLSEYALKPCAPLEYCSFGWLAPGEPAGSEMLRSVNGFQLICLGISEKLMPPTIIRETIAEKSAIVENEQARKLSRMEKAQMRDEIITDMLPKAFARKHRIYAYIDSANGWLIVDQSSRKRAEEMTEHLRIALGTLPVAPIQTLKSPSSLMTQWVLDDIPSTLSVGNECDLIDPAQSNATIKVKGIEANSDEVVSHIKAGKQVEKLEITWNERLTCVVTSSLEIKKLRFTDLIKDEADDQGGETELDKLDADLSIMTHELSHFLTDLFEWFGGVASEGE